MDETIKEGIRRTWRRDRLINRLSRRWDLQLIVFRLEPRLAVGDINLFNLDRLLEDLQRAFTSPLLALPAPLPTVDLPQPATTVNLVSNTSTAGVNTTRNAALHYRTPMHQPLNSSLATPTRVVVLQPNSTLVVVAPLNVAVNEATALATPFPVFVLRPAAAHTIAGFDHHAAVEETSVVVWAPTCELEHRASACSDNSQRVAPRVQLASPRSPTRCPQCQFMYWRDVLVSFLILVLVVRACGKKALHHSPWCTSELLVRSLSLHYYIKTVCAC